MKNNNNTSGNQFELRVNNGNNIPKQEFLPSSLSKLKKPTIVREGSREKAGKEQSTVKEIQKLIKEQRQKDVRNVRVYALYFDFKIDCNTGNRGSR